MALLTSFWLADIFLAIAAVISVIIGAIYVYFKLQFQHWQKRGFPVPFEPSFPQGNFSGVSTQKSMDLLAAEIYRKNKDRKVVGCYLLGNPVALVNDLDLVKNILIKDFGSFHDRFLIKVNTEKDPLGEHMFLIGGQEWRNIRIKLTPTFTSGKMKIMFPTMMAVGNQLVNIIEKSCDDDNIDTKDILARYSTDVIASVAFGLEANSLQNPNADFRKYGQKVANPDFRQTIMTLLIFTFPKLATCLPFSFLPRDISNFFMNAVQENIEYRTKNNIQRNDFFQLLLQLMTLGYVKDADNPDMKEEDQQKFTITQMASQAFLFFFAGFETTSATMHFALYELALNPDIQNTLQEEIDAKLAENDGKLSYDVLMSMDYLDRTVAETLRKYPPAGIIVRLCNKAYQIPGTNMTFQPGDNIWFPLYGYHHDPKYWPDPETFDPDRFLPEVKETRPHCAYMPFGDGPRNCIGNRFGLMQAKAGLALLLSKYDVNPSRKTPKIIEFDPKTSILTPKGNTHLKFSKRIP